MLYMHRVQDVHGPLRQLTVASQAIWSLFTNCDKTVRCYHALLGTVVGLRVFECSWLQLTVYTLCDDSLQVPLLKCLCQIITAF